MIAKHSQIGSKTQSKSVDPFQNRLQLCISKANAVLDYAPGAHTISGLSRQNRLVTFLSINCVFMIVEFLYGYMNNSLGMLSDAAHMLLDNVAVAIGLAAEYHAARCKLTGAACDPTGIRILAGFANGVILLFVALNIVLEAAVHVMGAGHDVTTHRLLPVSIAGLGINVIGLLFVHEAHHHGMTHDNGNDSNKHSHHGADSRCCCSGNGGSGGDPNMRAILLHIMADTLGSLAVILSTLAMQYLHWHWADPVASVAISVLIVAAVWPPVRQSATLLLERHAQSQTATLTAVPPEVLTALRRLEAEHGGIHVKTLCCLQVAGGSHVIAIQLEVPQGAVEATSDEVIQLARSALRQSGKVAEYFVEVVRSDAADNGTAAVLPDMSVNHDIGQNCSMHNSAPVVRQRSTAARQ